MMGGIAGRTIGSMLLDVPLAEHPAAPLDLARDRAAAACGSCGPTPQPPPKWCRLVAPLFNRPRRAA